MTTAADHRRYTAVAIVLHWAIAIGILAMIPFGWWMSDLIHAPDTRAHGVAAFQLHKSIGLSILMLSLARLGWRLMHPPPPLPAGMAQWERLAATATHWGFYVLMIALPLSGWAYVSTGFDQAGRPLVVPTLWFGLFEVPHLPIAGADEAVRRAASQGAMSAHSAMAWGAIGLAVLHVGAALKHQFFNKDGVLGRMVPGLPGQAVAPPAAPGRNIGLGIGLGAVVLIASALTVAALTPPAPSAPAATAEEPPPETGAPPAEPDPQVAVAVDAPPGPPVAEVPDGSRSLPVTPQGWVVDRQASSIRFAGDHAGAAIAGRFTRWSADIVFSPEALDRSRVQVRIETGSADTENPLHENTLREAEWFGGDQFPTALFEASQFRALGRSRYEAVGTLTIRDRSMPVTLPFSLRIEGGRASMAATLTVDRVAAGMGLVSDPNAEWVSRMIPVTIAVEATAAP
jgi:cytochrome b561